MTALTEIDRKRLTTVTARAALAGVTLRHANSSFIPNLFIVSRWGLCREFTDLDAVEQWLELVTGRKA